MRKRMYAGIIIFIIAVVVVIFIITRKQLPGISGSGMIEVRETALSPKITGTIKEMKVDEGTAVKAGDTLIILDHRELLAQKEEAAAGRAVAEQTLREAKARREDIEKNVERMRKLHAAGDVPDKELEAVEVQLTALTAQENKAQAGIKGAQARFSVVQTQIDNAFILSPLDGVVLARNFEPGELVYPGVQIMKIADLKSAWLKIYVLEKEVGKIVLGAKAEVYVDAYAGEVFKGNVTWISSEAEFTPKNIQTKDERAGLVFAVKITIPNPEQKLLPGMPADAKITNNGSR